MHLSGQPSQHICQGNYQCHVEIYDTMATLGTWDYRMAVVDARMRYVLQSVAFKGCQGFRMHGGLGTRVPSARGPAL